MYMFSHVLNFKHKKKIFTLMTFRASRISAFCTNSYSHRLKLILKVAQFCTVANIENKIRVSIFNTHEVVLQNKLAQFVIFLQAAKFLLGKSIFRRLLIFAQLFQRVHLVLTLEHFGVFQRMRENQYHQDNLSKCQ